MTSTFRIGDVSVADGERRVVHVPVANLYSHAAPLSIPVHVLRGRKPGPVLFVSAAIHGDELNGVEIIRRILRHPSLKRLSGTLLAIPVVNGFGLLHQSRYLPDRRDLNRAFPGSSGGSLAARLASIFMREIVEQSDYGVDLHTGSGARDNLPHVRANLDDPETLALANSVGVPVLIHSAARDGSLREVAAEKGVKTLLFEAGEALRFSELAIRVGELGILRLMRHIGMIPARKSKGIAQPYVARSSSWVRAPSTGMVSLRRKLGEFVQAGEAIARIFDPYEMLSDNSIDVRTEKEGIIIGISMNPLVHEGDALIHVARFAEAETVAEEVEVIHQDLLDNEMQS